MAFSATLRAKGSTSLGKTPTVACSSVRADFSPSAAAAGRAVANPAAATVRIRAPPVCKEDEEDEETEDEEDEEHLEEDEGASCEQGGDGEEDLPLPAAVRAGSLRDVRRLLAEGANPNERGAFGEPPLFLAAAVGSFGVAAALLLWGSDPGLQTPSGVEAIDVATNAGVGILLSLFKTEIDAKTKGVPLSKLTPKAREDVLGSLQRNGMRLIEKANALAAGDVAVVVREAIGQGEIEVLVPRGATFLELKKEIARRVNSDSIIEKGWLVQKKGSTFCAFRDCEFIDSVRHVLLLNAKLGGD